MPRKKKTKLLIVNKSRIARETGYTRTHIVHVFHGHVMPSVPCLAAIAKSLKLSLDDTAKAINILEARYKEKKAKREKMNTGVAERYEVE